MSALYEDITPFWMSRGRSSRCYSFQRWFLNSWGECSPITVVYMGSRCYSCGGWRSEQRRCLLCGGLRQTEVIWPKRRLLCILKRSGNESRSKSRRSQRLKPWGHHRKIGKFNLSTHVCLQNPGDSSYRRRTNWLYGVKARQLQKILISSIIRPKAILFFLWGGDNEKTN